LFKKIFIGLFSLVYTAIAASAPAPTIRVAAAASLTEVLENIGARFTTDTGIRVIYAFGASSALARQIASGEAIDVFISADETWMDDLARRGVIESASRRDIATNRLVLIAPRDSRLQLTLKPGAPLAAALGGERLAMADPEGVPAGRYGRAALTSLGLWDSVASRLLPAENVRAALLYVARGEAPLGVVYATDARVEGAVRVVDTFPSDSHTPIRYPAALVKGGAREGRAFLDYLHGATAREAFRAAGFGEAPPR